MHFKIAGRIEKVELIVSGKAIRERNRLWKAYGKARWRKLKGTPTWNSSMVRYAMRKSTGTKPTGLGRKSTKSSGFSTDMKREVQFVICVGNKGYAASLELRKIYQVIPDKAASGLHQIRVIDESGEDYLYPEDFFVPVQLPQAVERAVRRATA
jgi:hypothetical protein